VLQAVLNGSRPEDAHPALPVLARHLARDARAVARLGISAVHVHPRDANAQETLDPNYVPHGDDQRTAIRPEETGPTAAAPQFTLPYNGTPEQAIRSVYDQLQQGQFGSQPGSQYPPPQPPTTTETRSDHR